MRGVACQQIDGALPVDSNVGAHMITQKTTKRRIGFVYWSGGCISFSATLYLAESDLLAPFQVWWMLRTTSWSRATSDERSATSNWELAIDD
jgi:hypothetical protein